MEKAIVYFCYCRQLNIFDNIREHAWSPHFIIAYWKDCFMHKYVRVFIYCYLFVWCPYVGLTKFPSICVIAEEITYILIPLSFDWKTENRSSNNIFV